MRTIIAMLCLLMTIGASAKNKNHSGLSPTPTVIRPLTNQYNYYDDSTLPVYAVDEATDLGGYIINSYVTMRMVRTKKATYVTMTYKTGGEWWFYIFSKKTAIVDCDTHIRYMVKDLEDYPLNHIFFINGPGNRHVSFTLVFPPLPDDVKRINFIEPELPVRQNLSGKGFKVYNIDVETLCSLDPKSKPVSNLDMASSNNTTHPMSGKQWFDMMGIASDAIPSIDPVIPQASWEMGETTLRLHLLNENRAPMFAANIIHTNIFNINTPLTMTIGADGVGQVSLLQYGPAQVQIGLNGDTYIGQALIEPGKTTDIYVDQNIVYSNENPSNTGDSAEDRYAHYNFYTNGLYRDVNFVANTPAFLNSGKVEDYDFKGIAYTTSADDCTDSIITNYKLNVDRIAASYLPDFDKQVLRLYARQQAVAQLSDCDFRRALDFKKKEHKDASFYYKSFESQAIGAKQAARLNEVVNATDPLLLSAPALNAYLSGISGAFSSGNTGPEWLEQLGVKSGELHDVMAARKYYFMAQNGQLNATAKEELSKLGTPKVREFLTAHNESALNAMNQEGLLSNVEPTPDVADEQLFDAIVAQHKNKTIFVNFWNTWCTQCQLLMNEQAPFLELALKSDNIVWINIADDSSPIGTYNSIIPDIPGIHYRLPQQRIGAIFKKFGISTIPATVLVKPDSSYALRNDLQQTDRLLTELKKAM